MKTFDLSSSADISSDSGANPEAEAWVVNTLKVKMIKKLDNLLTDEGKLNARKLFLVPIFSIRELSKQVEEKAPELKTFYFKELLETVKDAEEKRV